MDKILNESKEDEETIINNDYIDSCFTEESYDSDSKIISFLTLYMSLSLKDKISRYLVNKNIRSIKNPITSDTLIHYLCMNDDNFPLLKLISPNKSEKEQKNNSGQTLLHVAVQNKSYNITKYLLEIGSNIQSKDINNNTPLHIAVRGGDFSIIKILLKNNSNLNIINNDNETPIDIAKKMKNKKLVNLINNYLQEKEHCRHTKSKNNIELRLNEFNKDDILYKLKNLENNNNIINNNKSILNNLSINNWSLDTKNETDSQSFNIYKRKIITNNSQYFRDYNDNGVIKNNKTINLYNSINNTNTQTKKNSYKSVNRICPVLGNKYIYRKTSPKVVNNQYTLIEFDNDSELYEYTPRKKSYSPRVLNKTNFQANSNLNRKKINNIIENKKIITYENYKNLMKFKSDKLLFQKNNNYSPLSINQLGNVNNGHHNIKKIRNTIIHKSPFSFFVKESKKEDIYKQKLLQFLKEIGMQNYGNILISEGLDDINLILKQMNEGFPVLEDTLKEIGIIPAGDRAKLLIRLQEVSNGFDFNFPFEEVYFKNNGSIIKWLKREGFPQYNKNFINAGYQSFELLLIQMASKYKINDNILINDLFIFNDADRVKILRSLEKNSEKYIQKLSNKGNIQRTFSKMVENDSESLCIIM